jgi:hypothetical protein
VSDFQQDSTWWLASDGKWYPPNSFSPPPPPNTRPTKLSWGLSGTLFGFQLGMALCAAVSTIAMVFALNKFEDIAAASSYDSAIRGFDTWNESHDIASVGLGLYFWLGAVVLTLGIIWTFKAHKAVAERDRKWGSGWSVGAWFIPLANNLLVPMVMAETATLSSRRRSDKIVDGSVRKPLITFLSIWWSTYFLGALIWIVGVGNAEDGETETAVRVAHWMALVGGTLTVVSLVCAAVFTYRQTQQLASYAKQV